MVALRISLYFHVNLPIVIKYFVWIYNGESHILSKQTVEFNGKFDLLLKLYNSHLLDIVDNVDVTSSTILIFGNFFTLNLKDENRVQSKEPLGVRHARDVMIVKEFPPDTPEIGREMVQLDIPSELFGQSADISLRASEVVGSLIQVNRFFLSIKEAHKKANSLYLPFFHSLFYSRTLLVVMQNLCNT